MIQPSDHLLDFYSVRCRLLFEESHQNQQGTPPNSSTTLKSTQQHTTLTTSDNPRFIHDPLGFSRHPNTNLNSWGRSHGRGSPNIQGRGRNNNNSYLYPWHYKGPSRPSFH